MNKEDTMLIALLGAWLKEKTPRKVFVVCTMPEPIAVAEVNGFLNLLNANIVRLDGNSVKRFCNGKASVPNPLLLLGADDTDDYTIERLLAADTKTMFFTKPNSALLKKAPADAIVIAAFPDEKN
jgi:hypothetical protein